MPGIALCASAGPGSSRRAPARPAAALSCKAGEERHAGQRDRAAARAHRDLARGPAHQQAEGDAEQMQEPGRDARSRSRRSADRPPRGSSVPWAWPWKIAKAPTTTAASQSGGRAGNATSRPSTTAEAAMPVSTAGTGTPRMPSAPPPAITSGNTTGSSQIAGAPRNAPHRPTATIATTWSQPKIGWVKPLDEAADRACRPHAPGRRHAERQKSRENHQHARAELHLRISARNPPSVAWRAVPCQRQRLVIRLGEAGGTAGIAERQALQAAPARPLITGRKARARGIPVRDHGTRRVAGPQRASG